MIPCSASIIEWLSTTPVSGDQTAALQLRAGSIARASALVISVRPSTPLISPCAWIAAIFFSSASFVATISLPVRFTGTPRNAQKS